MQQTSNLPIAIITIATTTDRIGSVHSPIFRPLEANRQSPNCQLHLEQSFLLWFIFSSPYQSPAAKHDAGLRGSPSNL
jgi:hypothetical protein